MKKILLTLALGMAVMSSIAHATTYKYLDSPARAIQYTKSEPLPAGSIFILKYEGDKEPTNKDRYFPYQCWSKNSHGPAYWSDSKAGQRCNDIPPPALVFAPSSFWYQAIPKEVTLHANNAAMVKDFNRQWKQYYNTVDINTWQYASPVFNAKPDTPTQDVAYWNCQKKTWTDPVFVAMMKKVPIPANAVPATGTDGEMTIYDAKQDAIWEMWKARKLATGKWEACWGGKIENASKSSGIHRQYYGTTAAGLPFQGGQITAEELLKGEIKHVMGIAMVQAAAYYGWPANRHDGQGGSPIFEGQRFRLDPTVDVDKLNLPKAGKIIAKAAQIYGFVVWDKAGAVTLRANAPVSYTTNPYPALFENKPSYSLLKGIPWDKLQFLPQDYGKPLPPVK